MMALQHHSKPLSREAQEEIIQGLKEKIALVESTTKPNTIDRDLALYHLLASGGISGINLIALPSADNKVHSTLFNTQETNTVIGRAPYDQANLWPVSQEGVAAVPNDKTAEFLDKKGAIIQYSFVGQNQPERA